MFRVNRAVTGMAVRAIAIAAVLATVRDANAQAPRSDGGSRVEQIERLRARLNDPNPTVRLVAAEEALASSDRMQISAVYEIGLASPDTRLRSFILRHHLSTIDNLVVGVRTSRPAANDVARRDQRARALIPVVAATAGWSNLAVDRATNNIRLNTGRYQWRGRLDALGFTVSLESCDIRMQLADAQTLRGELVCQNTPVMQLESTLQ